MSSDNIDQSGFEEYPEMASSRLPDFGAVMAQRLAPKLTQPDLPGFDPHAVMVKKNQIEKGEIQPDTASKVEYPADEVKALEDFCTKHGILGVNYGNKPPSVILALLRQQVGDYSDTSLENRIPMGYQKLGIKNSFSANYPYQHPQDKRKVLNG